MTAAPDLLQAIVAATTRITAVRRAREPLAELERRAAATSPDGARFERELGMAGRVNIIAECKRRSPSKGVLAADYDPVRIASLYEQGGAAAISVLTEPTFFDGSLEHLAAVRAAVRTPLLRKDFIVDDYQLFEARAAGADAVLLIVAALAQAELVRLQERAAGLGLATLVEVHDEAELARAVDSGARIIGVNNRNLRTLQVDVDASYRLAPRLPAGVIGVSESGLKSRVELDQLAAAGYRAFLIGERFMIDPTPVEALRALTGAGGWGLGAGRSLNGVGGSGVGAPNSGLGARGSGLEAGGSGLGVRDPELGSHPAPAPSRLGTEVSARTPSPEAPAPSPELGAPSPQPRGPSPQPRAPNPEPRAPIVKVCGITRLTDALHAVQQGATALGFVFWPRSPRFITPERAREIVAELPANVMTIGVFVNEPVDAIRDVVERTGINAVQLHGDEPPVYADILRGPLLRSVTVDDAADACTAWPAETVFLVDAADPVRRGGTGGLVDWTRAAGVARQRRVVLAGGLTPENVAAAIAAVRPYGVDVSTGVEESPGVKSFDKVARFVANARSAFEQR